MSGPVEEVDASKDEVLDGFDRALLCQVAKAAACYAYAAARQFQYGDRCLDDALPPEEWPFAPADWKVGKTAAQTLRYAAFMQSRALPGLSSAPPLFLKEEAIPAATKKASHLLAAAAAIADPHLFFDLTRRLNFGEVLAEGDFTSPTSDRDRLGGWVPIPPERCGKIIEPFSGWYRRPIEGGAQ